MTADVKMIRQNLPVPTQNVDKRVQYFYLRNSFEAIY